jgi:hypothetical protein
MTIQRAKRVQRSRKKGFVTAAGTIYVGRPTKWGNPFMARRWGHAKSVILHRRWLRGEIAALTLERMGFCAAEVDALQRLRARVLADLHQLAGCDLACWCPLTSTWCHAELLLDLAVDHAELERFAA